MRDRVEIYRNEERRIPRGIRTLRIPIVERMEINFPPCETISVPSLVVPQAYLELQRYRCTFHISYEVLEGLSLRGNSLNLNLCNVGTRAYTEVMDQITLMMQQASRETQGRLRQLQPMEEGHPVILNNVWLINQSESRLLAMDLEFWSIQHQDSDLGKSVFERIIHEMLTGSYTGEWHNTSGSSQLPMIDDGNWHHIAMVDMGGLHTAFGGKKYKDDAEENAHELLKGMITKEQFELYKKENYVKIKGTYGRTYIIRKGNMIEVTKKRLGCKAKSYRLCMEPRDRGTICPTDEVVAKIKLIRASEKKLHELANKFNGDLFGGGSITLDGNMDSVSFSPNNAFRPIDLIVSVSRDGGQTFTECRDAGGDNE